MAAGPGPARGCPPYPPHSGAGGPGRRPVRCWSCEACLPCNREAGVRVGAKEGGGGAQPCPGPPRPAGAHHSPSGPPAPRTRSPQPPPGHLRKRARRRGVPRKASGPTWPMRLPCRCSSSRASGRSGGTKDSSLWLRSSTWAEMMPRRPRGLEPQTSLPGHSTPAWASSPQPPPRCQTPSSPDRGTVAGWALGAGVPDRRGPACRGRDRSSRSRGWHFPHRAPSRHRLLTNRFLPN